MDSSVSTTTAASSARGDSLRWITLGAMVLTSFVGTWDFSAVAITLPDITREFGIGIDSAVWVLTAGTLMFSVPMAIFGKLGDLYGHRRIFLIATGAYVTFAVLAGIAPTFGWLLLFRGLLGFASAPAFTATMAFIAMNFEAEERGRAMGIMTMVASLAWAGGPVLGGLLVDAISWRAVILVEAPVAMLALIATWKLMPSDSNTTTARVNFDLAGAATLTASVFVLTFWLRAIGQDGLNGISAFLLAGILVLLVATFLVIETRHKTPFVPLSLFANHNFSATIVFSSLQMMMLFGMVLLVPLYLQEGRGFNARDAGLVISGLSIARIFFEPTAGRVAELIGSRIPSIAGVILMSVIALAFALWLSAETSTWVIFAGAFAFGVGTSFSRTPVFLAVTHLVKVERIGLAMGVFSMLTFAGAAIGQTTFGVLLRSLSGAGNNPLASVSPIDLLDAFKIMFFIVVGVAIFAAMFGSGLPGRNMTLKVKVVAEK